MMECVNSSPYVQRLINNSEPNNKDYLDAVKIAEGLSMNLYRLLTQDTEFALKLAAKASCNPIEFM